MLLFDLMKWLDIILLKIIIFIINILNFFYSLLISQQNRKYSSNTR